MADVRLTAEATRGLRPAASGRNPTVEGRTAFTAAEDRLIRRLHTPALVQRWLNSLPYNTEPPPGGPTLRSFRGVVRAGTAHCLEAAVAAAVILEQHGYPPLVLSFESIDELDHVLFVYRAQGRWGSIARSRDPGLHGRLPMFRSARALASSYIEPYVDFSGRITGYAVVDLRTLGAYDWRSSERNIWKVERMLIDHPHRPIRTSDRRIDRRRAWYYAFKRAHPGQKPVDYPGRERWSELPACFAPAGGGREAGGGTTPPPAAAGRKPQAAGRS